MTPLFPLPLFPNSTPLSGHLIGALALTDALNHLGEELRQILPSGGKIDRLLLPLPCLLAVLICGHQSIPKLLTAALLGFCKLKTQLRIGRMRIHRLNGSGEEEEGY